MDREMLKEARVHGEPSFPVGIYTMHYAAGEPLFDCHWHDEMEFLMVSDGRARFQIGTNVVELSAGQAIFVAGGELHAGYSWDGASCSFQALVFHPDFLRGPMFDVLQQKYLDPLISQSVLPPTVYRGEREWDRRVLGLLAPIMEWVEAKAPACELLTKGQLYTIFAFLYAEGLMETREPLPPANASKVERLKTVLQFIQAHYAEPIKLGDLAAQANMSEGHFCRFFKAMTQKTPIDYLNHYRIQRACRLLESGDPKVIEVALDVGIRDLSYFTSLFKQYTNLTPTGYRRQAERNHPTA